VQVYRIEAEDVAKAKSKLCEDLEIPETDLQFVESKKNIHSFKAITLHPLVEFEISRDKMSVTLKRLKAQVGDGVPKLNTDFVINKLKRKGVIFGIRTELITEELFKFVSSDHAADGRPMNVVIAKGEPPVAAQAGKPQWVIDLKLFAKNKPVFCRKDEILARAGLAVKGRPGVNVLGETIPFALEDSFRLPIGKGIRVEAKENESVYLTDASGKLILEQGIRMQLETKVQDLDEGLRAAVTIGEASFTGKKFTAQDLISMAEAGGIRFGILSAKELQSQLQSVSKWPALITVARGKEPQNGKPGKVEFVYKRSLGNREVDKEKAKLGIVFPNEVIARIPAPSAPEDGMTVFGEALRGRAYNEQPLYPGKNVIRQRKEGEDLLVASSYGRVRIEADRVHVENMMKVSADKMIASLDVFPQFELTTKDIQNLFRDADILVPISTELLESDLKKVHQSGVPSPEMVVARGIPVRPGKNARLRLYFNPEDLKEKGLFTKSQPKPLFTAPGDLVLEKILPTEPEEGMNVYRERLEVPSSMQAADVDVKVLGPIDEKEVGIEGSEMDPPRIQYRAATFGFLNYKNRQLSLKPAADIDEKETSFKLPITGRSDFGTTINFDLIQKFALEEGVKVDLQRLEIEKALRAPRAEDGVVPWVEIAKSIPAKNGEDSKIEYLVKYNGDEIEPLLDGQRELKDPEVLDLVRPKEVIATKTVAGVGVDGKSVFGRRLVAERGIDQPWRAGWGLTRSADGNSLVVDAKSPGYITIEDRRLALLIPIELSADKMSARMKIFPSKNPRWHPREDRIFEMLLARGIQAGILADELRSAIRECLASGEMCEVEVAKGLPPKAGRSAQYKLAFDIDLGGPSSREDGSIDYRAGSVYHMVKNGQLLMTKQEPTRGADGYNVLGDRLQGQLGQDQMVAAGEGVKLLGLEYVSTRDGIVEFTGKSIRVIEGLYIPGDVDFSSGNVDAGSARVMIRGSVLPGFQVKSESEVLIEKTAEACQIHSGQNVIVRGGIIGKDVGHVYAKTKIEALYANSGCTIECKGDILIRNEILNSAVRSGGSIQCDGTIAGGEIWVFDGLQTKTLGAAGSESKTKVYLGVNYLELKAAERRIEDEGIPVKERDYQERFDEAEARLKEIYERISEASKASPDEAQKLQDEYREWMEVKKEIQRNQELVKRQREVIMNAVQRNKACQITVRDLIHRGVSLIYKDVVWDLKEPMKSVVIQWNEAQANFVSRRI
jgi:uncharacterized protein (DUF342 family)